MFSRLFLLLIILPIPVLIYDFKRKRQWKVSKAIKTSIIFILILLIVATIVNQFFFALAGLNTCSMYHREKSFDDWWDQNQHKYNISKSEFKTFPFRNGIIHRMLPTTKIKPEDVKIGDVIEYDNPTAEFNLAHRIIRKWTENGSIMFLALGDNNDRYEIVHESQIRTKIVDSKIISFLAKDTCRDQGIEMYCEGKNQAPKSNCTQSNSLRQQKCLFDHILEQNDPDMCCSLEDPYVGKCFTHYAVKESDNKYCNIIGYDNPMFGNCIYELAVKTGNKDYCHLLGFVTYFACLDSKNRSHCNHYREWIDECLMWIDLNRKAHDYLNKSQH